MTAPAADRTPARARRRATGRRPARPGPRATARRLAARVRRTAWRAVAARAVPGPPGQDRTADVNGEAQ